MKNQNNTHQLKSHFMITLTVTLIILKCVMFLIYNHERFKVTLKQLQPLPHEKNAVDQEINIQWSKIKLKTQEIMFEQHKKDLHNICHMKHYLLMNDNGRLGNQMFEYSALYRLTKLYNVSSAMSTVQRDYLKKLFPNISLPVYKNTTGCWKNHTCQLGSLKEFKLLRKFAFADCPNKNIYINDYGVKPHNVNKLRKSLVGEEFAFNQSITLLVEKYLMDIKRKHFGFPNHDVQVVGVHVRRGDFERFMSHISTRGGFFLSRMYFLNAMDFFRYLRKCDLG